MKQFFYVISMTLKRSLIRHFAASSQWILMKCDEPLCLVISMTLLWILTRTWLRHLSDVGMDVWVISACCVLRVLWCGSTVYLGRQSWRFLGAPSQNSDNVFSLCRTPPTTFRPCGVGLWRPMVFCDRTFPVLPWVQNDPWCQWTNVVIYMKTQFITCVFIY